MKTAIKCIFEKFVQFILLKPNFIDPQFRKKKSCSQRRCTLRVYSSVSVLICWLQIAQEENPSSTKNSIYKQKYTHTHILHTFVGIQRTLEIVSESEHPMEFPSKIMPRAEGNTTVIMTRTARRGRRNKKFYYERVRAPTGQNDKNDKNVISRGNFILLQLFFNMTATLLPTRAGRRPAATRCPTERYSRLMALRVFEILSGNGMF